MNKARRQALDLLMQELDTIKAKIEDVAAEEGEAFDNLPEGLQQSERGEAMENALSMLEDVVTSLDEAIDNISEVINS